MNNLSKKIAISFVAVATLITSAQGVLAQTVTTSTNTSAAVTTTAKVRTYAFLKYMKVSAIDGTNLTMIAANGKTFTVDASSATIIRKFGAASSMAEVAVGDMLWVKGTVATRGGTAVTAKKIRNMSVHAAHSTVSGTVQSVSSTGFVLSNYGQTTYTITVNSSTQYRNNTQNQFAGLSDVMVGDRIRTFGLIDTALKTETADAVRLLGRGDQMPSNPVDTSTQQTTQTSATESTQVTQASQTTSTQQ